MSYPKQLQLFDENVIGGNIGTPSFGDNVVLTNGSTPPVNYTVNICLRFIEENFTGYLTTLGHTKHEPRFRPFDTDFGDTVVFPSGVALTSNQAANEIIEIIRVLWDIDRQVTSNSFGHATSVLN